MRSIGGAKREAIEWINQMCGNTTKTKDGHYHLHVKGKKYALWQVSGMAGNHITSIGIFELTTKENLFALINAYAQGMYIQNQIINLKHMEELQWEREEAKARQ